MKTVTPSTLTDEAGPAKSPQLPAPDGFGNAPPLSSPPGAFALINALLADLQGGTGRAPGHHSKFADLARQRICHAAGIAAMDQKP